MQTLSDLTGNATARIKSDTTAKARQEDGPNFFERARKRLLSGEAHAKYAEAVSNGKAHAETFMAAVHNPKHPDHSSSVLAYRNSYGMDVSKVRQAMIDRACLAANADNPEDLKEDLIHSLQKYVEVDEPEPAAVPLIGAPGATVDADDTEVTVERMTEEELLKGLEGLTPPEEQPEEEE